MQECLGRKKLRAHRGELDCQWQPVELTADGCHGSGVLISEGEIGSRGLGALYEQGHRRH
jgi:hypothetical protein